MFFSKPKYHYLIVGLGNPGLQYENTRHNAGFMALDAVIEKFGGSCGLHKFDSLWGEGTIAGEPVLYCKPQTYMNLSGKAVTAIASFYKIPTDRIIILYDDICLDVGKIRVRPKGSDGGHNGMKDIIQLTGTQELMRVRIGVGAKPHPDYDLAKWVLGKIPKELSGDFSKALEKTALAVEELIRNGPAEAMNRYNG